MFAIARHGSCVKVLCTNYSWQRGWALRNETKQSKVKGRPILSRDGFTFLCHIWSLILECKKIKGFETVRPWKTNLFIFWTIFFYLFVSPVRNLSQWTHGGCETRFHCSYEIPENQVSPLFSVLPTIPPLRQATTRKQYKVLTANKYSATFYDRCCSFYCHTKSRFIGRILFFPFLKISVRDIRAELCPLRNRKTTQPSASPRKTSRSPVLRLTVCGPILSRVSVAHSVIPLIAAISNLLNRVRFTLAAISLPLATISSTILFALYTSNYNER